MIGLFFHTKTLLSIDVDAGDATDSEEYLG